MHDTEYRRLSLAPGLGLDTICQVLPFHTIAIVSYALLSSVPTAKHNDVDAHDTEDKV